MCLSQAFGQHRLLGVSVSSVPRPIPSTERGACPFIPSLTEQIWTNHFQYQSLISAPATPLIKRTGLLVWMGETDNIQINKTITERSLCYEEETVKGGSQADWGP